MDGKLAALVLIVAVHVVAIGVLVWAILDGDGSGWRDWWPGDGGQDGAPRRTPDDDPRGGGLPLPDAQPAAARLRTAHERLANRAGRRVRRPAHAPEPGRTREPV